MHQHHLVGFCPLGVISLAPALAACFLVLLQGGEAQEGGRSSCCSQQYPWCSRPLGSAQGCQPSPCQPGPSSCSGPAATTAAADAAAAVAAAGCPAGASCHEQGCQDAGHSESRLWQVLGRHECWSPDVGVLCFSVTAVQPGASFTCSHWLPCHCQSQVMYHIAVFALA